jgi:hypothetical protein
MVRRGGYAPPFPQCQCGDLLLIYQRVSYADCAAKRNGPGWICAINLPIQSRALCGLSYGANLEPIAGAAPAWVASLASARSPFGLPTAGDLETPMCRSVRLRDECMTALPNRPKTTEASGHAPQPARLQVHPVSNRRRHASPLWLPMKNGCPRWIRAINLPGQSRALYF